MRLLILVAAGLLVLTACDLENSIYTNNALNTKSAYAQLTASPGACSAMPIANTSLVVTAAHCVEKDTPDNISLVVSGTTIPVTSVWVHPEHAGTAGVGNDIAVLRTEITFPDDGFASHLSRNTQPSSKVVAVGWPRRLGTVDGEPLPWQCEPAPEEPRITGPVFSLPCQGIPGASGTAAVEVIGGTRQLVGVLSSASEYVTLSTFGAVSEVWEVIDHYNISFV